MCRHRTVSQATGNANSKLEYSLNILQKMTLMRQLEWDTLYYNSMVTLCNMKKKYGTYKNSLFDSIIQHPNVSKCVNSFLINK